jgi:hypothetical protein
MPQQASPPPPLPPQQWPAQQPQQFAPVPAQPLQYATPMQYAPSTDMVWRDGAQLIIRKDTALPDLCVKCNAPGDGYRWRKTLYWHHPALGLLILVNLLVYAIVALVVRQKTKVEASVCRVHRAKRTRALLIGWIVGGVLGIGAFIASIAMFNDRQLDDYAGFVMLGSILLMLAGLIYGMYVGRILYPKKIDANFAWLGGCGPAFLENFPPARP